MAKHHQMECHPFWLVFEKFCYFCRQCSRISKWHALELWVNSVLIINSIEVELFHNFG